MNYVVLARKYRPQTFDDVVAQEHVTRTLRNAVKNNRVGSGYLFCGPRGTGKTTVARILAKIINCETGSTENPCGVCASCLAITSGSSLDVLEIDAASNTGVDDMRTLRENIRYMPTSGKKRIYIIDEVHRLSGSAFDALLKTLEEPPSHVMFVFATTEPLKVPETILSRTQRYDFRRVSLDDLVKHLGNISRQEKIQISEAALAIVARKGDGSVRDSLSLLDQVIAFVGDKVEEQDVVSALGLVDRQFLMDFTAAIAAADRRQALRMTKRIFDSGLDAADFIQELLDHFRTLMAIQTDPESSGSLPFIASEIVELKKQAEFFKLGDLLRLMQIVIEMNTDLKSGLDERLLLEVSAVKMAEMESTVKLQEVLDRLDAGATLSPAPNSGAPKSGETPDFFRRQPLREAAPAPASSGGTTRPVSAEPIDYPGKSINLPQLRAGWEGFLAVFRQSSPMLASQLRMGEVKSVKDNVVSVLFYASGDASRQLVTKPENLSLITRTLRDHFKANLSIKFDIDTENEHPTIGKEQAAQAKVDPKQLVDRSPRLKSILDKVDGEIIGVRKVE
ncbi:MAG: DNA polymerase III subunit gamma/tau [Candidatus Zixiibacteriota bacterium]